MNKLAIYNAWLKPANFCLLLITLLFLSPGCKKMNIDKKDLRDFNQVNLVANSSAYSPVTVDPTLRNAWGLAWSPGGIAWVNANAGHVSELYSGEGAIIRPGVNIPSPTDTIGGTPTGIVFAGGAGFKLANGSGAAFLFDGDDGVLSGWNGPANNNALRIANNSATALYKGLALTTWNGRHFLYAANFKSGKIEVWDTTFTSVPLPFNDPFLPAGFSPFNIQAIGSWLFVTYAKVGPNGEDEEAGAGLGFVDIFNPDGSFVRRFASQGTLNAPWGITMSPANFLDDGDMDEEDHGHKNDNNGHNDDAENPVILVGNFGDGRINVFSLEGQFLGQLQNHNKTIVIEGLWALGFAPATATTIDPQRLYFTAGPADETDGIFGYLIKN